MRALLVASLFASCAFAADAPAPARGTPIPLANPGFEEVSPSPRRFVGWQTSVHAVRDAYLFALDETKPHSGKLSMRVTRNSQEPWGAVHQNVKPQGLAGKTLEFSAWLRIEGNTGPGAVLTLRNFKAGAVDQVVTLSPPVTGTVGWKRYSVRLAIPPGTTGIEVNAMLQGDGTLWVDDAELVVLDAT